MTHGNGDEGEELHIPVYPPKTEFEAWLQAELHVLSKRLSAFEIEQQVLIATAQRAERAAKSAVNATASILDHLGDMRGDVYNLAAGADQARKDAARAAARAENAVAIAKSVLKQAGAEFPEEESKTDRGTGRTVSE